MKKLIVCTLAMAAFVVVGSGSQIELKGWKSTTSGSLLMPGCGINGGTALGVQSLLKLCQTKDKEMA